MLPWLPVMGCGGRRRKSPSGGCANGIPLNESIPKSDLSVSEVQLLVPYYDPVTVAESRVTTGAS
jgi:hypothetical protein